MEGNINFEKNLEDNIICKECHNIPLLGLQFLDKCDNISNIIKVNSYCIFKHKNDKNKINELSINDIFKNKSNKKLIKSFENFCDNCKTKNVESLCLKCKRNVCNECIKFYKSHKIYQNKKYLYSQNDIKNLEKELNNSKNIINKNLSLIQNQIKIFKL